MTIKDFKIVFRSLRSLKFEFHFEGYLKGYLLDLYLVICKNKKKFPTFALILQVVLPIHFVIS